MVLQRDEPGARINGRANNNGFVQVNLKSANGATVQTIDTFADATGAWTIRFEPVEGSLDQFTIDISDSSGTETISNVVFGDVFHCTGQSNMERPMGFKNAENNGDTRQSDLQAVSNIRYISAKNFNNNQVNNPQFQWNGFREGNGGNWCISSITNSNCYNSNGANGFPSSVCSYAALTYSQVINNEIPIGMMITAKGGSGIHMFMSPSAVADTKPGSGTCGGTSLTPLGTTDEDNGKDDAIYNQYLHPMKFLVFKAIFWYQGEKNSKDDQSLTDQYKCEQAAFFAKTIREDTDQPDLPVFVTELTGNGKNPGASADIAKANFRNAQRTVALIGNAFSIFTLDQGVETSDTSHSPYKKQVGVRHGLKFMKQVLGFNVDALSPQINLENPFTINGNLMTVNFIVDDTAPPGNLIFEDGTDCSNSENSRTLKCCSGFSNFLIKNGFAETEAPVNAFTSFTSTTVTIDLVAVGVNPATVTGVQHMFTKFTGCALKIEYPCFAGVVPFQTVNRIAVEDFDI